MDPLSFLREVKNEIDKVVWPSRKQAFEMTVVVVVISIIVGIYVGGLDLIFTSVMNTIIK